MKQLLVIAFAFSLTCSYGQFTRQSEPLAHTFSIVARDARTGEMAVAVQSHWFSVGTVVAWGEAGVGVIATQSFVNKSFGPRGLELLKLGKAPQDVLDYLIDTDSGKDFRQVAIVDAQGRVAAHTGKRCIAEAAHIQGDGFSVQANMMLNSNIVPSMEKTWKESASLPLAERMLAVLKAAQQAGGDIRGKQSAALLVVAAKATEPWNDRRVDLRVDDHTDPLTELERLLQVYRAYEFMNQGDLYVEQGNMDKAMEAYRAAMKMFPGNLEMQYWTAITLAGNNDIQQASAMLQKIYRQDPHWRELTKRLPAPGLLNVSPEVFKELTK